MRVLLIENDGATTQLIERMLKSESFNLYTMNLGEEGVNRAGPGNLHRTISGVSA
jgi:hypothetical protein